MAASDEQPEESRTPVTTIAAGSGPSAPSAAARSVAEEELRAPRGGAPVAPGDVVAGKYRVEEILGEGGMGVVVAARHLALGERVALKFLLPAYAKHANSSARFAREARAAAKIRGEHVARVMDVGALEDGSPFIVMEHLDGVDLARHLTANGPLTPDQAITFVLQACEAIAEAHSVGIVHRDLKPANLFLTRRPDGSASVKVLDFGISKFLDGASAGESDLTKTAGVVGSPVYMSPEQLQSAKDVDARTDVWSLGTILFELVTGAQPFIADSVPQTVARIMSLPAPKLREFRQSAPELLESVVDRALAKDRAARFSSVGELARALRPIAPPSAILSIDRVCAILASPAAEVPNARARDPLKEGEKHRSASASDPRGETASGLSTIVGVAESEAQIATLQSAPRSAAAATIAATASPVSVRLDAKSTADPVRPSMQPRSNGSILLAIAVGVAIGGVVVAKIVGGGSAPSVAASTAASTPVVNPSPTVASPPIVATPPSVAPVAPIVSASSMGAPIASASMLAAGRASASARSSSAPSPRASASVSTPAPTSARPSPAPSSSKPHAASDDITIQ